MDPSVLIAAGIIGSVAGGLGFSYALRAQSIRRYQDRSISPLNALPVQPDTWKEILAWAHRYVRGQVSFGNETLIYQHFFEKLPPDWKHWETLDLAVNEFHTQAFLQDSRYKEFNIRKAMDGLVRSSLLEGKGGENVLVYAMRRELSGGGRYYTPVHLEKHPGYAGMVSFALTHRNVSMDWGSAFQPSTGQLILQLLRRYQATPAEALSLLIRMRDQYRKIYPQLFVEGAGQKLVLTRMFFTLPPKLLSEVYGKEFEKVFSESLQLKAADTGQGLACRTDRCRPVLHLGHAACPVCWNPDSLEEGVTSITGIVGEVGTLPQDERSIPIPVPFNLQDLPAIEKLVLGHVQGISADAIVDQALVFTDRLPKPVRIEVTGGFSPSERHMLMIREHNQRVSE